MDILDGFFGYLRQPAYQRSPAAANQTHLQTVQQAATPSSGMALSSQDQAQRMVTQRANQTIAPAASQKPDLIGSTVNWFNGANAQASSFIKQRLPPQLKPGNPIYEAAAPTAISIATAITRGPTFLATPPAVRDFQVGMIKGGYDEFVEQPVTAGASYVAGAAIGGGLGLAAKGGARLAGSAAVKTLPKVDAFVSSVSKYDLLGKGTKAMGAIYALDVGARVVGPDQTPRGMGERAGGILATEAIPMYYGGRSAMAALDAAPATIAGARAKLSRISARNDILSAPTEAIDLQYINPKYLAVGDQMPYSHLRTRMGHTAARVRQTLDMPYGDAFGPTKARLNPPYEPWRETYYLKEPDYLSFAAKAYPRSPSPLSKVRAALDTPHEPWRETYYLKEPDYLSFAERAYAKPRMDVIDLTGKTPGDVTEILPPSPRRPSSFPSRPAGRQQPSLLQEERQKPAIDVLDLTDVPVKQADLSFDIRIAPARSRPALSQQQRQGSPALLTLQRPPRGMTSGLEDARATQSIEETLAVPKDLSFAPKTGRRSRSGTHTFISTASLPAISDATEPVIVPEVVSGKIPKIINPPIPIIYDPIIEIETPPPVVISQGGKFPPWGFAPPVAGGGSPKRRKRARAFTVENPVPDIPFFFGTGPRSPAGKKAKAQPATMEIPGAFLSGPGAKRQSKKKKPGRRGGILAGPGKEFFEVRFDDT